MKTAKNVLLGILISISTIGTYSAQTEFEVPKNVKLKNKEDYAKYEEDFVNAAKWLEETDLNKETEKRQKVNAFVIEWISGSPTISVEISAELGKIYGDNAQLLGVYLASYGRHYIENKEASQFSATKAALLSMITVYKKGIKITKSKEMEKILKLSDEELDEYIKTKLKAK